MDCEFDLGEALIELLPRLRRFALKMARSSDVADDLVQSACERALATPSERGESVPFDAWMFRIIRNLWIDRLRRLKTQGTKVDIEEHIEISGSDGRAETESKLTLQHVSSAIDRLPDEQREVLLLICVEELSYKDAAQVLDVPIGTIMSRLARARLKLAEMTGLASAQGAG